MLEAVGGYLVLNDTVISCTTCINVSVKIASFATVKSCVMLIAILCLDSRGTLKVL